VRQGQTLSHIAQQQLGDSKRWLELAALNNLGPDAKVKLGQRIVLPEPGTTVDVNGGAGTRSGQEIGTQGSGEVQHHTVKSGEYLGSISTLYYGTSKETERILTANNLRNADQIRAGQVLVIPPRD